MQGDSRTCREPVGLSHLQELLDRLTCDPATEQLTYRLDKADGPTAGTTALDPLGLLSRVR